MMSSPPYHGLLSSNIFRCKHTLPIVSAISHNPLRFSELRQTLNIDSKVLARKLSILRSNGLVTVDGVRYRLTEDGKHIVEVVAPIISEISPQVLGEILKCKWSKELLTSMLSGPKYSIDIVKEVVGLSWKVASERLKKLQRYGLITRTVHAENTPPRVAYDLTRKGKLLALWLLSANLSTTNDRVALSTFV